MHTHLGTGTLISLNSTKEWPNIWESNDILWIHKSSNNRMLNHKGKKEEINVCWA